MRRLLLTIVLLMATIAFGLNYCGKKDEDKNNGSGLLLLLGVSAVQACAPNSTNFFVNIPCGAAQ